MKILIKFFLLSLLLSINAVGFADDFISTNATPDYEASSSPAYEPSTYEPEPDDEQGMEEPSVNWDDDY